MDWLNWISTAIISIAKEGLKVTSVIVILAALLKVPWVQRAVFHYMPKKFRPRQHTTNTDVLYEVREIKALLGVETCGALEAGTVTATSLSTLSNSLQVVNYPKGRSQMKSKLLSRKFILAVVSAALVILNDGLDLGIDKDTVIAFAGIVATYIIGESAVDVSNKPKTTNKDYDTTGMGE